MITVRSDSLSGIGRGDRLVVAAQNAVAHLPVVLSPNLAGKFEIRTFKTLEDDLGRHGGAVRTAAWLGEVLLVVGLSEVKGLIGLDFGCDRPETSCSKPVLVALLAGQGQSHLLRCCCVDSGAVLSAGVISLPIPLRWIVTFPEQLQKIGEVNGWGTPHHSNHFGVACSSRTHLLIRGILILPSGISDSSTDDPGQSPEALLGSPEAATRKNRFFLIAKKRSSKSGAENGMAFVG